MKTQFNKYKLLFKEMFDDLKTKGHRHKQIPNMLTMLRLLAPFVIIPAFVLGNLPLAFASIIGFSLTDALDGFIARHFKLTSDLGKDLDAVADKIFAGTLLISISIIEPIYLLLLSFELAIGSVGTYKKINSYNMKTCFIGKIKTILLDIAVILGIGATLINVPSLLLDSLCISTSLLQIITMKKYIDLNEKIEEEQIESLENKEEIEEIIDDEEIYDKTFTYHNEYENSNIKEKTLVKTITRKK